MGLKDLTLLITAAGSPGVPGLIQSLKAIDERKIRFIASDVDENAIGLFLADKRYIETLSDAPEYASEILDICRREKVDVVIPNTGLLTLSENLEKFEQNGVMVLVSRNSQAVARISHKGYLFDLLKENNLPVPDYRVVRRLDEFTDAVSSLGYPNNPVCFKPVRSEGTRGFRILRSDVDRMNLLLNEKPDSTVVTLEDVISIFSSAGSFPDLLVMEYLPGREYSVDLLLKNGEALIAVPRYRSVTRLGLSTIGIVEENKEVERLAREVAEISGLDFNINVQIKYSAKNEPKVIEINPRVSGTLVLCTAANANLAYLGVKTLLDEPFPIPIIKYGTKMIRFWSEIYTDEDGCTYTL